MNLTPDWRSRIWFSQLAVGPKLAIANEIQHPAARTYPPVDLSGFALDEEVDLHAHARQPAESFRGRILGTCPPELIQQDGEKLILKGADRLARHGDREVLCCVVFDVALYLVVVDVVCEEETSSVVSLGQDGRGSGENLHGSHSCTEYRGRASPNFIDEGRRKNEYE